MKCILLVRVSTEAQSYDEQEKELYDLAHFYGYKDKDISSIATKESAIKLDEEERFGLNRMKELLETRVRLGNLTYRQKKKDSVQYFGIFD